MASNGSGSNTTHLFSDSKHKRHSQQRALEPPTPAHKSELSNFPETSELVLQGIHHLELSYISLM